MAWLRSAELLKGMPLLPDAHPMPEVDELLQLIVQPKLVIVKLILIQANLLCKKCPVARMLRHIFAKQPESICMMLLDIFQLGTDLLLQHGICLPEDTVHNAPQLVFH